MKIACTRLFACLYKQVLISYCDLNHSAGIAWPLRNVRFHGIEFTIIREGVGTEHRE